MSSWPEAMSASCEPVSRALEPPIRIEQICSILTIAYASKPGYGMRVVKRTSLNLDLELVGQARAVLGSNGTTDTIHRALEEVVRREKLRRLSERTFEDLTPEALERLRATRTW